MLNISRLLAPLTALSALVAMLALSGLWLPHAWGFVAKPLTTLLIIGYAWQRGRATPVLRRWLLLGLAFSLAGDVCLLWPEQGFLPGLVSFLLAHLCYIKAFCTPVLFAKVPEPIAFYAALAGAVLSQLWSGVPAALRAPVAVYVVCLAAMAAQSAVWWRSEPRNARARWAAVGGLLFLCSDTLLAVNKFATPLPLASLWILATYWAAQWCIASSLAGDTA
nr:lysoplasmalogenase [uncultured Roseateles sp.]